MRPVGNNPCGHCRCGPSGTVRHVSRSRDNLTARLNSSGYNFRPQSHRFGDWIRDRSTEGCVLRPPRPRCAAPIRRALRRAPFVRYVRPLRSGLPGARRALRRAPLARYVRPLRGALRSARCALRRAPLARCVRPLRGGLPGARYALCCGPSARFTPAYTGSGFRRRVADLLLRVAAVLETVFFEASVFFFLGSDVFLAGRPRALLPPPDLEAVVFDDLAIHNSFELDWDLPAPGARQQSNRKRGQRREFPWEPRNNLEALCESSPSRSPSTGRATCGEPIDEIADRERCTKRHVADTLPLAFLAPGLVRAVIEARLPRGISTRSIAEPELEWSRQWTTLGIRTRPASLARLSQT